MARKTKKKGNTVSIDFTDVGAGNVLHPDGAYGFKTIEAENNEEKESIIVKAEITSAPSKKLIGKVVQIYFSLEANRLWVLRQYLDASGVETPDGPGDIDLDELADTEFTAVNEQYDGQSGLRNSWKNFGSADGASADEEEEDEAEVDEDEDEDEDEAPKKKSKKDRREARKAKKSKKVVEEDEDEDEDAEEESDEDEDEDEAPKKKSKKGKADKKAKKSKKVVDEEDEEDEDEAEEEAGPTEDEVNEMSPKELKGLIKKHKLDVDLDDFPTIKKQRIQVILALEEEGLIG